MKINNIVKFASLVLIVITYGCANTSNKIEEVVSETSQLIQITQEQFDSDSMKIGELTLCNFEKEVVCNAYIASPSDGMAQVSSHISGIVETITCSLGDYVKKGEPLAMLTSNELIILQQNFIEASAQLMQLKSVYERGKALLEDNIGSKKDFISVESEYKKVVAQYQSLKLQLEMLSLDVDRIADGELYSVFPVIAPITGYITNINIILGQAIDQQKKLIEIVDINKLQLQLSVFENDLRYLEVGQDVRFNLLGNQGDIHYAKLTSVGRTINMESMTIICIAEIIKDNSYNFINNSYVEARIIVDKQEKPGLPAEAIIKSGNDYFVLVAERMENQSYYLRKEKVKIGRRYNGFVEIIDGDSITNVITNGVYNLYNE